MYAVFKTGGKQYRASTGDVIKVEKIEAEKGATVELDQVLMVGEGEDVKIGAPYLDGGKPPLPPLPPPPPPPPPPPSLLLSFIHSSP